MLLSACARPLVATTLALLTTVPDPPVQAARPRTSERVLTASLAATGITHLELTSLDGPVDVRADPDPAASVITVSASLAQRPATHSRQDVPVDLNKIVLGAAASGNIMRIGLRHAAGRPVTTWDIRVPSRFSVTIIAQDGSVAVTGVEGGVRVSVNTGLAGPAALSVDVPRGVLDLQVVVGEISARHRSTQFDRADLNATVGRARLFLLGHEVVTSREPGAGHRIRLAGEGPDLLRLRATVGDVKLQIG
jgi:hypothetical protein